MLMTISNRWKIHMSLEEKCSKLFSCLRGRNEIFRQNLVFLGNFLKRTKFYLFYVCAVMIAPCSCTGLQYQEINSILCENERYIYLPKP